MENLPIYEAPREVIQKVSGEFADPISRERFRDLILEKQHQIEQLIKWGVLNPVHDQDNINQYFAEGAPPDYQFIAKLTHYFSPMHEEYGCCAYARQIILPKGSFVIGKIHRHEHLNFFMNGKVTVYTESGQEYFDKGHVFVSERATKRAIVTHEQAWWVTVHLTKHRGEQYLDKIEEEVIAPIYDEIGLIPSTVPLVGATGGRP